MKFFIELQMNSVREKFEHRKMIRFKKKAFIHVPSTLMSRAYCSGCTERRVTNLSPIFEMPTSMHS